MGVHWRRLFPPAKSGAILYTYYCFFFSPLILFSLLFYVMFLPTLLGSSDLGEDMSFWEKQNKYTVCIVFLLRLILRVIQMAQLVMALVTKSQALSLITGTPMMGEEN